MRGGEPSGAPALALAGELSAASRAYTDLGRAAHTGSTAGFAAATTEVTRVVKVTTAAGERLLRLALHPHSLAIVSF